MKLNARQQQAVDTTEGAVLVLAGPGTGKTQLLSMRAAKIVQQGSVSAQNILCLTYTEAGASEMRERITRIMGIDGSDVAVHTFHSFGTWLIGQYPEYFAAEKALSPLDDLGRYHVLESLLRKLPLRHPLAVRDENERFVKQHAVAEAIQKFKEAGLSPTDLRKTLESNAQTLAKLEPLLAELFDTRLSQKRLPEITTAVAAYQAEAGTVLGTILLDSLLTAIDDSDSLGKTSPLGDWRTEHTVVKNAVRVFKSSAKAQELLDTIDLYEAYQKQLSELGRYDYADMVLWAAEALEKDADMRLDVAERYQYIMVDEYQDTNGAQNRLLDALLSSAIDAPNILVVGDDDQAIMRFQGAEVSGTLQFIEKYQPTVIVLEDNYRSTQAILDAARAVITKTDERLEVIVAHLGLTKELTAHSDAKTMLKHLSFSSPTVQYAAIAERINKLIEQGVDPKEIAVIGRKHAELKLVVPFLTAVGLSVAYDGKESILESAAMQQLIQLASLVEALANHPAKAKNLLLAVLAGPYWDLPALDIYRLAATARTDGTSLLDTMLTSDNPQMTQIAEWLITAANASKTHNFTQTFDMLIGRAAVADTALQTSPFKQYLETTNNEAYAKLLSNLITLRAAVLASRPAASGLADMLAVIEDYRRSETKLFDDSPILQGDLQGVQLMSAHGAKGREFEHVFILSALDNVWGNRARSNNRRIHLPENLPLYPPGDTTADKLRLLYVAMTRAKSSLIVSSYELTDEGKATTSLSFLQEAWAEPEPQTIPSGSRAAMLETAWLPQEQPSNRSLHDVLEPLLRNFTLSPSSLKSFLDLLHAGPMATIESAVLKFPSAYNVHSALGNAVHEVLLAAHTAFAKSKPLSKEQILTQFDDELQKSGLAAAELEAAKAHGHQFLPNFISVFSKTDFPAITSTEKFVSARLPNGASINGKIDAIKEQGDALTVIDYKTGTPPQGWDTKGLTDGKQSSLHFYRQQLLFYKLLLEHSTAYKGKKVTCAQLVFVEPGSDSTEHTTLNITDFSDAELAETAALIKAVQTRIVTMELPDTSKYSLDLKGIKQFEADVLANAN
jgi:DNA helicase-2/ATP-dependent DNA helicase PcrA